MVYLSRIYTRTGDEGETSLGDRSRVPKDHARVSAYGTVDELNAALGIFLAAASPDDAELVTLLRSVQNDLFDVGADLCMPQSAEEKPDQVLRVQPRQSERLEAAIDRYNENLSPLTSFVLPGGTPAAAWCHLARTICRRAERLISELKDQADESVTPELLQYVNRLSDFLFVAARYANDQGARDMLWRPGEHR